MVSKKGREGQFGQKKKASSRQRKNKDSSDAKFKKKRISVNIYLLSKIANEMVQKAENCHSKRAQGIIVKLCRPERC